MRVFGLHIVDVITLTAILGTIVYFGFRAHRQVKSMGDYIIGQRKFGKLFMIMHAFGTGTHTDQAVIVAGQTAAHGLSGIWAQWLWLFCTPFYWLIAPIFRRMRYLTTADYFRERFHGSLEVMFVLMGMLVLTVDMGVMLLGQGTIINAVTDQHISVPTAIFIMVALFVFYGVSGGLIAAIITDFIQGFFIVIMSFVMLPIALVRIGGFSGLHDKLDPSMFSLVASGKYTVFFIGMIALNALVNIVTQPHTMGNCAAGKTEFDGRVGFCFGTFIKRICTVWWAFTGLFAVILFPTVIQQDADLAFGICVKKLLPLGLTGVMLASMMAAMMSSCDSLMIAMSGLFTNNVYQRYLVKNAEPRHYLLVIRIVSIFAVGMGLAWAFYFNDLFHGLELFWKLSALTGVAFWLGLLWRRANRYGAWAAFLAASLVYVGTNQGWVPLPPYTAEAYQQWGAKHEKEAPEATATTPVAETGHADAEAAASAQVADSYLDAVRETKLTKPVGWAEFYESGTLAVWPLTRGSPDAWSYVFYLAAGFLMGILITLVTPPEPPEKIYKFFTLISTPVGKEDELRAKGIEILHEGGGD